MVKIVLGWMVFGLSACGSITTTTADTHPTALMTYDACVSYCGCALLPNFDPTGLGICICIHPDAGAAEMAAIYSCRCGGWSQPLDSGSDGALLWSTAAMCSSLNQ
jgi:hypothetical protein